MRTIRPLSLSLLLVAVVPTEVANTFCEQQLMQDAFPYTNDNTHLDDVSDFVSELVDAGDDLYYEENRDWFEDSRLPPLRTCDDLPATNPRGHYSTALVPCTFTFHSVPGDTFTDGFAMPTACFTDDTDVGEGSIMADYLDRWPDECVGDFARCYSIQEDQRIYLRTACRRKWNVPNGSTHFSVDCTADKAAKMKMMQDGGTIDPYMKQQMEQQMKLLHEVEIAVIVAGVAAVLLCVACCYMGHRWWVVPYQESLKSQRQESLDLVPRVEKGPLDDNENYYAGGARVV